jgi:methyl-galactoside transport system substrate-binding protein
MKTFKKILTFFIILITIASILASCNIKMVNALVSGTTRKIVKAGVLVNNLYNPYNVLIKKSLEDIQKENEDKIEFTFFDGMGNPAVESEIMNNMIENKYDLIIAGIVDKREPELIEDFIYKARQNNIPLIFYNITPTKLDAIKGYTKSLIINTDSVQAGILQGKMIADAWNADKENMDKNSDNIMQYIMLKGEVGSFAAIARSKYSISTINDAGIKTQELASTVANWNTEIAQSAINALFLNYSNKVEAIIANNDAMAIGAVKALQKYGYNMGDKAKTIPVYGIGAIPEAQELIKKGFMAGSVLQNSRELADAIYTVGMNLVSGNNPLEGTNYKFNDTGVIILIPFKAYTGENVNS